VIREQPPDVQSIPQKIVKIPNLEPPQTRALIVEKLPDEDGEQLVERWLAPERRVVFKRFEGSSPKLPQNVIIIWKYDGKQTTKGEYIGSECVDKLAPPKHAKNFTVTTTAELPPLARDMPAPHGERWWNDVARDSRFVPKLVGDVTKLKYIDLEAEGLDEYFDQVDLEAEGLDEYVDQVYQEWKIEIPQTHVNTIYQTIF